MRKPLPLTKRFRRRRRPAKRRFSDFRLSLTLTLVILTDYCNLAFHTHVRSLGSVKGMAAKNQIEQMLAEDELERNRQEVTAAAKKRQAEKAVEVHLI